METLYTFVGVIFMASVYIFAAAFMITIAIESYRHFRSERPSQIDARIRETTGNRLIASSWWFSGETQLALRIIGQEMVRGCWWDEWTIRQKINRLRDEGK